MREYKLSQEAQSKNIAWTGFPNRESLEDLGRKIIESVPLEKRAAFSSPLLEGFNNLNIPFETVQKALLNTTLAGKSLLAVGKTEWANLKWNDATIAEKKNLINSVDFVFTAAESPAQAVAARDSLLAANVNARLLDCSDAHQLSTSLEKDRIGLCTTWIKAELTFRGLKYARLEYENRVCLNDRPQVLSRIVRSPGKFMESVSIVPSQSCPGANTWFDVTLKLNPEMVCIIGNKGTGKSALVDVLGLAGHSKNEARFSFLSPERFRKKPTNPSRWFDVKLRWKDGRETVLNLSQSVDRSKTDEVRYLPQSFLESLCNEVPSHEESQLDRELKRIIFECLPASGRLGKSNLDAIISELSAEYSGQIEVAKGRVAELNKSIIQWESLEVPGRKTSLDSNLAQLKELLSKHESKRPEAVIAPELDPAVAATVGSLSEQQSAVQVEIDELLVRITALEEEQRTSNSRLLAVRKARSAVQDATSYVEKKQIEITQILASAGVSGEVDKLLELRADPRPLVVMQKQIEQRLGEISVLIDDSDSASLYGQLDEKKRKREAITSQMSEPIRRFVQYGQNLAEWQAARERLVGTPEIEGTVAWAESELKRLVDAPSSLQGLYKERRAAVKAVVELLQQLARALRELYQPAEKLFLKDGGSNRVPIGFSVELEARSFTESLLDFIHLGMRSGFQGQEQADANVRELLADCRFDDPESIAEFVEKVLLRIRTVREQGGSLTRIDVSSVLKGGRSSQQLYDFVSTLGYLTPTFHLLFESKDISMLSPGQRGMVLLLFYLLVDPETIPLLIDQPEENLDNQTVASYLTDAFRVARGRRQVVVVTHNANLAVVCDADQVIRCGRNGDEFVYESSALESLSAIDPIVNVLEGTRRAFEDRESKYRR